MRPSKNHLIIKALAIEIKHRRTELGFPQEDLAGWCELDRPYILLIEVGRKQPTLIVLLRLAEGLQYSLTDFMERMQIRYQREQAATRELSAQHHTPKHLEKRQNSSGLALKHVDFNVIFYEAGALQAVN